MPDYFAGDVWIYELTGFASDYGPAPPQPPAMICRRRRHISSAPSVVATMRPVGQLRNGTIAG